MSGDSAGLEVGSVLLVEDDKRILRIIKVCLQGIPLPQKIITRTQPETAMEVIADKDVKIDLAIFDHNFNNSPFTGLDLVEYVRERQKNVHVIMIAGAAPEEGSLEMHRKGVEAFFGKPFDVKAFQEKVARLLNIEL